MPKKPQYGKFHHEKKKYYEAGVGECWRTLKEKMQVPPSLEVFVYGYQRSLAASPEEYAEHYNPGDFGEEEYAIPGSG